MSPLHVARALIVALALLAYAPAILFGDLQHLNVEDDVHLPRGRPATLGAALRWCAFEAPRLGTAGPLGACLQVAVNWVGASAAAARVASLACHLWVAVSSLGLCYRLGDDAAAAAAAVGLLVAAHPLHAQAVAWARHLPALAAAGFALEAAHKALDGRSAAAAGPLALYTAATSANPGDFESWAALGHATKEDPTKDDNDTDLGHESLSYYSRAMEAGAGEKPCGIAEVMTQYLGSNLDAAACWERRAGSDRPARGSRRASERPTRQRAAPAPRRRRRRGAAAACDPTWDAPHLNWGILEIDRENRDAAYGHFRDQLARAPNRGSLRRLKILRDINEGDPTIAKIVADFEARHAELG
ncbi:hypothetical protein JL721_2000 [Aureococcus anophagefferens]|nr:hypothetical protein JL721_2000 [Aureococcus anophagefferens]